MARRPRSRTPRAFPKTLTGLLASIALAVLAALGAKTTCGQIASCEEARFHLTPCGVKHLDRDGDGVPCASLCNR